MNDHQKCTVMTYKEKYEKTKQELISVQASVVSSSAQEEEGDNTKETTVHLEDELRMVAVIFTCLVAVEFNFKRQILEIRKTFHLILFNSISFRFVSILWNTVCTAALLISPKSIHTLRYNFQFLSKKNSVNKCKYN